MNDKEQSELKSKVKVVVLEFLSQIHYFVRQHRPKKSRKVAGNNGDLRIKYSFELVAVI